LVEFDYTALSGAGQTVRGTVRAAARADAIEQLLTQGRYVTRIEPRSVAGHAAGSAGRRRGKAVVPRQRLALLRQLSVGLSAGLPLVQALAVVKDQAEHAGVAELTGDLVERVTRGDALSEAMAAHPGVFSAMQISMTRAGETAGALDQMMGSLSDFAERDLELREKLRAAAMYPMMVVGLGVVSIAVIVLFILPRIMVVVAETGGDLPWPTRVVMAVTEGLRTPGGAVAAALLAVGAVALWRWTRTEEGRLAVDGLKLRLPVVGTAVRRVAVSRFARTLGTLAGAGIQIVPAMRIVRDTLGNEVLARHLDTAADGVERGQSIADELRSSGQFPQLLIQVIAMGERTGRLDSLLMQTADSYDKETASALDKMMSILPVLIILVLALFVAFILAAALLPIMGMDVGA
jgi:type II secretory pathway component PulF